MVFGATLVVFGATLVAFGGADFVVGATAFVVFGAAALVIFGASLVVEAAGLDAEAVLARVLAAALEVSEDVDVDGVTVDVSASVVLGGSLVGDVGDVTTSMTSDAPADDDGPSAVPALHPASSEAAISIAATRRIIIAPTFIGPAPYLDDRQRAARLKMVGEYGRTAARIRDGYHGLDPVVNARPQVHVIAGITRSS